MGGGIGTRVLERWGRWEIIVYDRNVSFICFGRRLVWVIGFCEIRRVRGDGVILLVTCEFLYWVIGSRRGIKRGSGGGVYGDFFCVGELFVFFLGGDVGGFGFFFRGALYFGEKIKKKCWLERLVFYIWFFEGFLFVVVSWC